LRNVVQLHSDWRATGWVGGAVRLGLTVAILGSVVPTISQGRSNEEFEQSSPAGSLLSVGGDHMERR
jgi:hypothetical protein